VDGDTRALSLAPSADGGAVLGCNGNAGLAPVARWTPGASSWTSLALPDSRLAGAGGALGPLLAGRGDGALALVWRGVGPPLGQRLAGATFNRGAWRALSAPLDAVDGATAEARVALGPREDLFAAWLETVGDRRRVRASRLPLPMQ
jgi:hypothetical protein